MKFLFVTLTLLFLIVGANSFAANTNTIQEDKKDLNSTKYDFNVFKLFTLNDVKSSIDSLHIATLPKVIKGKED